MDVFQFAMKAEKDGEKYYRDLAAKSPDTGLATILRMLADAEVTHYNTLKEIAEGTDALVSETTLLARVKNVFVRMRNEKKTFDFNVSQIDLYKKAQDLEKKSQEFYLQRADIAESRAQRELFVRLAREEREHWVILQNLIEFLSTPTTWLENAEWHHLDEY
jgi:rubrerythrin